MGVTAARKAARIVANTRRILAIEVLAACQALEFLKPLETSPPLAGVYRRVRERVAPYADDRALAPEIEGIAELVCAGVLVEAAESFCGRLE
jgi:histidine ammonia-lyase